MKTNFPSVLKKDPTVVFSKLSLPVLLIVIMVNVCLRVWKFGTDGTTGFEMTHAMIGVALFACITIFIFVVLKGGSLDAYARLQILYLSFVPRVSFVYLQRLSKPSRLFALREDVEAQKFWGALGYWTEEILPVFQILVPTLILLLGAYVMISTEHYAFAFRMPRWYLVSIAIAVLMTLLILPFSSLSNLLQYFLHLILVTICWNLWEKIRKSDTLEPMAIVAWAEILLFTAFWLKSIVDMVG